MHKLLAAMVEVSNRRPLSMLCLILSSEVLVLRWIYHFAGGSAAIVAWYAGAVLLFLWAYAVTKANKKERERNAHKRRS